MRGATKVVPAAAAFAALLSCTQLHGISQHASADAAQDDTVQRRRYESRAACGWLAALLASCRSCGSGHLFSVHVCTHRRPLVLALYAEATGGEMPGAQEPHCGVIVAPLASFASTRLHTNANNARFVRKARGTATSALAVAVIAH